MKVLYLCDRQQCKKRCSYPTCRHTHKLKHAINHTRRPSDEFIKKNFNAIGQDMYFEKDLES